MRQDASAVAADHAAPVFGLRVAADAAPIPAVPGLRRREAALSPLVRRVIDHLESNYLAPGLLQDLARTLNRSRFQVIRSFRREMQITPHAYLIRLRIIHAIRLLQRGEAIAQVAAATGFSDQSHLTRHFKRWTGTTPGVFARTRTVALAS
jgi:transcriptional regulator GlxA family with amidase domain